MIMGLCGGWGWPLPLTLTAGEVIRVISLISRSLFGWFGAAITAMTPSLPPSLPSLLSFSLSTFLLGLDSHLTVVDDQQVMSGHVRGKGGHVRSCQGREVMSGEGGMCDTNLFEVGKVDQINS